MKKLKVVIVVVISFIILNSSIFGYTANINENIDGITKVLNQELPDTKTILSIPIEFIWTFVKAFLIVILFYFFVDVLCKILIGGNSRYKTIKSNRKLGEAMDRMAKLRGY